MWEMSWWKVKMTRSFKTMCTDVIERTLILTLINAIWGIQFLTNIELCFSKSKYLCLPDLTTLSPHVHWSQVLGQSKAVIALCHQYKCISVYLSCNNIPNSSLWKILWGVVCKHEKVLSMQTYGTSCSVSPWIWGLLEGKTSLATGF